MGCGGKDGLPRAERRVRGELTQPAEGSVLIALVLARSAWELWQTEAEPSAGPWADLPLLLVLALCVGFKPQRVPELLAGLFSESLLAVGMS